MDTKIAGIAVRGAPRAEPEHLANSLVTMVAGLPGNFRGIEKARRRRQVTLIHADDWEAACAESGCRMEWSARRCDLLVEGGPLPMRTGALIRVGTAVLEITGECDPCVRMDALHQGLRAALTPAWRGGRLARIVEEGYLEVGSSVTVLDDQGARAAG